MVAYFQAFCCSKTQFYQIPLISSLSRDCHLSGTQQGQVTIQTLTQMINRERDYFEFKQAQITKAFSNSGLAYSDIKT